MCLNSRANLMLVAPGDKPVNQPVGPAIFHVLLRETHPQEIVSVIWERQIQFESPTPDGASLGGIRLK
jgi:hypothetical protein